jgi:hypothetical protein
MDTCSSRNRDIVLEQCHAGALEELGALKTVADVMNIVEQDRPFYEE